MVKKKLIKSIKGPNGGFFFDRKLQVLKIKWIIDAIETDPDKHEKCMCGGCTAIAPCGIRRDMAVVTDRYNFVLQKTFLYLIVEEDR